ncbi:MAG: copper homeostasis protein CutC [Breznakia sp.]
MKPVTFEVCAGSYEDCLCAYYEGADRVELNSALHMGGLTPTTATLKLVKKNTNIKVACMIRTRGAGFFYTTREVEVMRKEAMELLEAGSDAIVFGFLNEDHSVDKTLTREFVQLAHAYHKEAVFHRAIDCVVDIEQGVIDLIDCGVDRMLSSGGANSAYEGRKQLEKLQNIYGDKIEILAGVGIHSGNVDALLKSGITQIHSSCKTWVEDGTSSNTVVDYSYHKAYPNAYEVVDSQKVRALKTTLEATSINNQEH